MRAKVTCEVRSAIEGAQSQTPAHRQAKINNYIHIYDSWQAARYGTKNDSLGT